MQKCDLLIKGADVLISSGELRENMDIAIADGRILAVDADLANSMRRVRRSTAGISCLCRGWWTATCTPGSSC